MQSPQTYVSPNEKCIIRINDQMYDCTTWRASHPGGRELVDRFHNQDATDVFYAFHSLKAMDMIKKWKSKPANDNAIPRNPAGVALRKLTAQMEADGWFQRNWFEDVFKVILPCLAFCVIGSLISWQYPLLGAILIGIGQQQGGWVAHDYLHSRDGKKVGEVIGCIIDGMSPAWWRHKHNTHHSFTNRLNVDADIHNEPILHVWFPTKGKDVWFRRYQHMYYLPVYSLLYASWRLQSLQFVFASGNWYERVLLLIGYLWLACLPWKVAVGSVLIGGWLVAVIVTCSHQAEPIVEENAHYDFVTEQFEGTRGVACPDPVTEYLFGGMQYQLEHHLFPTLPKYRYGKVRPIVRRFAKENGLNFKVAGVVEIMKINYAVMKKFAQSVEMAE